MKYDASTTVGKTKAIRYFNQLIKKGATFELKEINVRTMSQHKYIHVLTGYFATVYGCSPEEAKQVFFKQVCGNEILFKVEVINEKTGEVFTFLKSVSDLTKEESSKSIDTFIVWALDVAEIVLPKSDEHRFLSECIIEINKNVNV